MKIFENQVNTGVSKILFSLRDVAYIRKLGNLTYVRLGSVMMKKFILKIKKIYLKFLLESAESLTEQSIESFVSPLLRTAIN